jgi:hypothetical protein
MLRSVQSDFSSLDATGPDEALNSGAAIANCSDCSIKSRKRTLASDFTKESFFREIKTGAAATMQSVHAPMSLDEIADSLKAINYEPIRNNMNGAPPKRFYRTFWRSITRRLLQAGQSCDLKH